MDERFNLSKSHEKEQTSSPLFEKQLIDGLGQPEKLNRTESLPKHFDPPNNPFMLTDQTTLIQEAKSQQTHPAAVNIAKEANTMSGGLVGAAKEQEHHEASINPASTHEPNRLGGLVGEVYEEMFRHAKRSDSLRKEPEAPATQSSIQGLPKQGR